MLKIKRKLVVVPSIFLWEKVTQDFAASQPWQKLKRNLLMLVQILALVLLVLALSRPFIKYNQLLGNRIALLIDVSPSMLATDVKPNRLTAALTKANELVNALQPNEQMLIMSVGTYAKLESGFTSDKRSLLQALNKVRKERGSSADFTSALNLVKSISKNAYVTVHIITDGRIPELPSDLLSGLSVRFTKIGQNKENVGITSAAFSFNQLTQTGEIFVSVANFFPNDVKADLDLYYGNDIIETKNINILGNTQTDLTFGGLKTDFDNIQAYKLVLNIEDYLKLDNIVYLVPTPPQPIEVLLVSDNYLITKALVSNKNFTLTKASEIPSDLAERFHLAIVEGTKGQKTLPRGNYLLINVPDNPYLPVNLGKAYGPLRVVDYQQNSPVFRYVNLRDVRFLQANSTTLRSFGRSLAEGPEGPIISEGIFQGRKVIHFAFSLEQTDLPLRASYPILINNICRYLTQQSSDSGISKTTTQYRIGDRLERQVPPTVGKVVVIDPSGQKSTVQTQNNSFSFSNLNQIGLYKVILYDNSDRQLNVKKSNSKDTDQLSAYQPQDPKLQETYKLAALPFAVNITSIEESRIEPLNRLGRERNNIISTDTLLTNKEFTKWLLLAFLAVIAFEWVLFHRRLV